LAHGNPDKIEAAYQRSDLEAKRRAMMNDWAEAAIGSSRPLQLCLPTQSVSEVTTSVAVG
jgi:hypothetical protein